MNKAFSGKDIYLEQRSQNLVGFRSLHDQLQNLPFLLDENPRGENDDDDDNINNRLPAASSPLPHPPFHFYATK